MENSEMKGLSTGQFSKRSEEACRNVAALYNSGNNCDKAVFLALQQISLLSEEVWDFSDLYSEKPDDTEQFVCKVLAAGAVAIYLDILTRRYQELGVAGPNGPQPIERVNALMNAILKESAAGRHEQFEVFDPFEHDQYLQPQVVDEKMRSEYRQRVDRLSAGFKQTFNCRDCVDILGFDPFSYELYDEEVQEQIESGQWMAKCVECMKHIIKDFTRADE
jgi:hypothetical protein